MQKTVIITGANRGIGLALAKIFNKHEWKVLTTCRSIANAPKELASISSVYALDVTSEDSILSLRKELSNLPVDLLINNAGINLRASGGFETVIAEDMLKEYHTNAIGAFLVLRGLLENLKASSNPVAINISSTMGSIAENASGNYYGYRASKAALNAITKSLSIDIPQVKIFAVHPGYIQTDMTGDRGDMDTTECASRLFKLFDRACNTSDYKTGAFLHRDGREIAF